MSIPPLCLLPSHPPRTGLFSWRVACWPLALTVGPTMHVSCPPTHPGGKRMEIEADPPHLHRLCRSLASVQTSLASILATALRGHANARWPMKRAPDEKLHDPAGNPPSGS